MNILNLTQHEATPAQIEAGVEDLRPALRAKVGELLTFQTLPSREELTSRAEAVVAFLRSLECDACHLTGGYCGGSCNGAFEWFALRAVMIGGAPFFMAPLEAALKKAGFKPVYAFSQRESVDHVEPDGSIRKVAVFRHLGFVDA